MTEFESQKTVTVTTKQNFAGFVAQDRLLAAHPDLAVQVTGEIIEAARRQDGDYTPDQRVRAKASEGVSVTDLDNFELQRLHWINEQPSVLVSLGKDGSSLETFSGMLDILPWNADEGRIIDETEKMVTGDPDERFAHGCGEALVAGRAVAVVVHPAIFAIQRDIWFNEHC